MYNLDFEAAHKTFESWQEGHPDDPLGPVSNAAAYLFAEFDRLRILDLDLFSDNDRLKDRSKQTPDSKIKLAFESELARTDSLAAKVLTADATDSNALF